LIALVCKAREDLALSSPMETGRAQPRVIWESSY